jgi:hypothetical protein
MEMWRKCGEAASAAALYSVYSGLYSEAVVSSVASAVALAEVGRFREAVEYVQRAAKALYEAARDVFEHVRVTAQRLVKLFVKAVTQVLAWVDEHKAYLFLMAVVSAVVMALSAALNLWGLVELEKLAYAASLTPFVAGLADARGRAAERFRAVAERWKVDDKEEEKIENIIKEIINAPLRGETSQSSRRPYGALLELSKSANLPKPLVELREALKDVKDEVVQDAAVVAALVLYKTLVKNAWVYGEWAELYRWARGLVGREEFTVATSDIERLRGSQRRLEEVAEEVRRELNSVLALYASHSRDLYEKLRPHLEVDVKKAEELAEARVKELSKYSDANMGTKAYAALLSIARGGIYGHAAMLLVGEGALADIVMSAPVTAYNKAKEIARGRGKAADPSYSRKEAKTGKIARGYGGAVDPSRLRVEAADWEDRAASTLLRFLIEYGEADLKFRRVVKDGGKGFQVFRVYGGVETFVGELWIGKVARFNVSKEELKRFVEEAKKRKPDLSGIKEIRQTLAWLATDVTFNKECIEAATAHTWQAAWYVALFGEPESISGRADVTEKGVKPDVTMRWRREVLDRIIAEEGRELEPLLGYPVKSWRELVDAIDWSWVLKKVEELAGALKPWIGRVDASDAEREGLARKMLGELALLVHFAEARRGMDDSRWREERATRLSKVVAALSGGKIAGEYAERLARAIIYYAEGYKKYAEGLIESLAREAGVSKEEVQDIVNFVLSDMYCLARDCARDEVVRKFVEPALELIMLDKALNKKFSREEALRIFGEMYATAVAGDGHVGRRLVELTVGGELGGGAALLRLATLYLLNKLLSDELKFGVQTYIKEGRYYNIAAYGENAERLKRLLAVSAPSSGGGYLSPKFDQFVEAARVEVRVDNIRLTESGYVAADLIISEGDVEIKYNVYLWEKISLEFLSTDRSRMELAARLLKLASVSAEVRKKGDRDVWYVRVTTEKLAAGREELRKAIAEIVKKAVENGWVDAGKAEGWLKKLEEGRVLKEGWPEYYVGLTRSGAFVVRYRSTNSGNIEREKQRLENMGLEEGRHFAVKKPEEGRDGYVYIRREGLERAARLSVYGKDEQQRRLAAEFVEHILRRAEEAGEDVYRKALEVVKEGKTRRALRLEGFEGMVELGGKTHVVKVVGWSAKLEKSQSGKKLLRIRITAEVDDVQRNYEITYGRYGKDNAAVGYAYARSDAPGGKEADAKGFAALVKALTGKEPRIIERSNGTIRMECYREHLDGFMRYAELADAIEKWLEETKL